MSYMINAGIAISLDNTNWYYITDHNREQIDISNELIEHAQRMANGRMRKYVIANKRKFSTSWKDLPSNPTNVVDYNKHAYPTVSSSWLAAFYSANVFLPIYVKFTYAKEVNPSTGSVPSDATYQSSTTASEIIQCFITKFDVKVKKRMKAWDYVDMDIEFTEI